MLFASPSPPFPPPPPPPPRDPTLTPEVFVPSFLFFPPRSLLPLPCLSSPFGYSSPKERKGRRLYTAERDWLERERGEGNGIKKLACCVSVWRGGEGRGEPARGLWEQSISRRVPISRPRRPPFFRQVISRNCRVYGLPGWLRRDGRTAVHPTATHACSWLQKRAALPMTGKFHELLHLCIYHERIPTCSHVVPFRMAEVMLSPCLPGNMRRGRVHLTPSHTRTEARCPLQHHFSLLPLPSFPSCWCHGRDDGASSSVIRLQKQE